MDTHSNCFFVAVSMFGNPTTKREQFTYTKLDTAISEGKLKKITVDMETGEASGELRDNTTFKVNINSPDKLQEKIDEYNKGKSASEKIDLNFIPPTRFPVWVSAIPNILMLVMLGIVWFIFIQQSQGGGGKGVMNFGKSRARLVNNDKKKVTFNDVAGADEEKQELAEVVDFLKQPRRYIELVQEYLREYYLLVLQGQVRHFLQRQLQEKQECHFSV